MGYYNMEDLFRERKKVGKNILEIMKEKGYTKISFSQAANISRPTLNHLFEGEINSKTTFEKHIEKISLTLGIGEEDLMLGSKVFEPICHAVYSCNEPEDYTPSQKEKEKFDTLKDLINLCEFYY